MKMELIVEVKNGVNMPSVNTFGGCDPFVEVRCVRGKPKDSDGSVNDVPKDTAQTTVKAGDLTPDWNEELTLSKAQYGKDYFVNVILWDNNVAANTPIGFVTVPTTELLKGAMYDPGAQTPAKIEYVAKEFKSLLPDKSTNLSSLINLSFSFFEVHKFKISIKKASHLPRVDTIGSIDAFVEVRIIDGDPRQMEYTKTPGAESKWSGKTETINDNTDPTFNHELTCLAPANPKLNVVVVVTDSGALGNTPVGMVVIPFSKFITKKMDDVQTYKSKLEKLPNWPAPENLKLATVSWSLSRTLAMAD